MGKAALIAWREIRWEIFGDRGAVIRTGFFALLPILFVMSGRGVPGGPNEGSLLLLALQSTLIPALSGVALIASTFTQEKENGTLVPLLAAPIRDIDIVAGKLIAVLLPAAGLSIVSLIAYDLAATLEFGQERISHLLTPTTLYGLFALAVFFILTIGGWVMVVSARVGSQRTAQQIAGFVLGGMVVGLSAIGSVLQNIPAELVIGVVIAVLLSDLVALELARRFWDREEAVARL